MITFKLLWLKKNQNIPSPEIILNIVREVFSFKLRCIDLKAHEQMRELNVLNLFTDRSVMWDSLSLKQVFLHAIRVAENRIEK